MKQTKKILITAIGILVLLIGLALSAPLVPGPGILLVLAGLTILASEYPWAKVLIEKIKAKLHKWFKRN